MFNRPPPIPAERLGMARMTIADRRVAVVGLTAAGLAQLTDWERAHEQRIGEALDQLPAADQRSIRGALPALAHLVDHLADPVVDRIAGPNR